MSIPSGIVCIDKPPGVSSFQALNALKKRLGTGKVGHTGTLDGFATGLLVVCVGIMTKLVTFFTGQDKRYAASFRFGEETDTLDTEGTIVRHMPLPGFEAIRDALEAFRGPILQKPPAYSAVHINGERAYRLARKGVAFEPPGREVTIHGLEIISWHPPELECVIDCSTGTYIRSLARDIGRAAGSCAYTSALRRLQVGGYSVEEAVHPDDFIPERHLITGKSCFEHLPAIGTAGIHDRFRRDILDGKSPVESFFIDPPGMDGLWALFDERGEFLALSEKKGPSFTFRFVASRQ